MTQKNIVRRLLEEAGPDGVSNHDLIYGHGITRAGARIWELRTQDGLDIETIDLGYTPDGRRRLANYVLKGAVKKEPPPPMDPLVATAIRWDCGCIRSADGRSWDERCGRHRASW
jgi:hypothetical protein